MIKRNKLPFKVMATSVLLSTGLVLGGGVGPTGSLTGIQVAEAADTYYKTTDNLNMRKSASTKAQKITTIPKGKQVTYISKSGSWFKVKYGTKTGFVSSQYLTKVTASSTVSSSGSATSTSVYTTTDNLRLRKQASTSSATLLTIPKGKTVTYVSKSGSWYKVKYLSKTGYVSSKYIKVTKKTSSSASASTSTSTTMKATKYKTTEKLNMRSNASTSGTRILTIPKDKVVTATAKSSSWYKVSYGGKTGWVSGSYIKEYNQTTTTSTNYYNTKAASSLYSAANTNKAAVYSIPKNNVFTSTQQVVNSIGETWYRVSYKGKNYYIQSSSVNKVTAASVTSTFYTAKEATYLYSFAGATHGTLVAIPKGAKITTNYRIGDWYKTSYGGKTGYIDLTKFTKTVATSETSIKATKYKVTANLILRKTASDSGAKLNTIPANTVVTATAKSGSWYKVSYSGQTGWVSGSYLQEYNQTTTTSTTYYNTKAASSLYSAPNTNKAAVYSIPKNNVFTSTQQVVNSIGETWYRVSYKGNNYYIQSGSVSKVTAANVTSTSFTAKEKTYLYSFAGASHGTLVTIPEGAKVTTNYRIGDWYKTSYGGKTGYIDLTKFTKTVSSTTPSFTATEFKTTANVNLRETASASGAKLTTIPVNTVVTATEQSGDWYKVTYNGYTGWVSGAYLTKYTSSTGNNSSSSNNGNQTTLPSGTAITETTYLPISELNIRASDSTSSAKVGSIPKYTQVKSTYKTSKGWYRVTYGGVTGFVSGEYLITKANYDKMNSYEANKNSYMHLDLRKKSSVTAAQINAYIAKHATSANSVLYNKGSAFITAANKYGVNALYLAAHAIHESNYGKSTIALAKNNLFGFGSYDITPFVGSVKFSSIEENIAFIAQEMKATYLNPSNWKYKGATLGYTIKDANGNRITDLSKGMNFYYASDSDWGNKIAKHMSNILDYGNEGAVSQSPNTTVPAKPSYPSGKDVFPTGTIAVANSSISLRNSKSSSATVAATIKKGETFNLLEKWNDYWLTINYKGKTYYTNTVSLSTYNQYMTVKNLARVNGASTLNVRASVNTASATVGTLKNHQYVELVVDSSNNPITSSGWYKVKLSNGTVGWASGSFLARELNK
ncbi:SH3 domain-containing protein [Bacillus sp. FJAT-27986]|uniref:SH3 domain-containing protein n=1 Tax=Bacillus sp. FJAT-27986 TaxID=1743146 RepID=UPI00080AFC3B|nr:SH3 domain-containing protein [Bacillus sp. FJAT-27986]OCA84655.1 hypothetical protein A8L44_09655 [Bacillus sp. FJAT-27986]